MHFFHHLLRGAYRARARCTARGDQRCGFLPDDFVINFFINIQPAGLFDLQQLAFAELADGRRNDFQYFEFLVIDRKQQPAREQVVAY
ncbi:hypothetical protein D3C87_1879640 [compost metagenome]